VIYKWSKWVASRRRNAKRPGLESPIIEPEQVVGLNRNHWPLSTGIYTKPLQVAPWLATGRNACIAEGVIRGTGKSPLSA